MTTQISAEVIQSSVGPNGIPIHTLRLVYPRFIHAENKTHRRLRIGNDVWTLEEEVGVMDDPLLSRNAASSRAIPISKVQEQVRDDPAKPIHFGVNQKGMQAEQELSGTARELAEMHWENLGRHMSHRVQDLVNLNAHKQVVNRLLEPWQWMVVVVTATDWKNFFHLRCHKDAQPEIKRLAELAQEAIENSYCFELQTGELHVPFVSRQREGGEMRYSILNSEGEQQFITPDEALKVSASVSAQTSFRALDYSLEKAVSIYDKLVESKPVHASPFEHQAIALSSAADLVYRTSSHMGVYFEWPEGITHMDRDLNLWSGNFRGWIQNRQLINQHDVKG